MKTQGLLEAPEAPQITGDTLVDQIAWERHAIELGKHKFAKDLKHAERRGGFQTRDDAQRIIKGALPLVSTHIGLWILQNERPEGVTTGRVNGALSSLKLVDVDELALIGLSSVFNGIAPKAQVFQTVAVNAGRQVEIALEAIAIREKDPKRYKLIQKLVEGESSAKRNERTHDKMATKTDRETGATVYDLRLDWTDTKRFTVGGALLECVLVALPELFERQTVTRQTRQGPMSEISIGLTEEGAEYMMELQDALGWMNPKLLPMVVKPRKWTHLDTGAYLDASIGKTVPLCRTRVGEQKKLIKEAIKDGSMASMLAAINALQETGRRIDKDILQVEEWCFDNGLRPGGSNGTFPSTKKPEKPSKLSDAEWADASPKKKRAVSRRTAKVIQISKTMGAEAGVFKADMMTANWLADLPAFYLPHNLDSRGRVLRIPTIPRRDTDMITRIVPI